MSYPDSMAAANGVLRAAEAWAVAWDAFEDPTSYFGAGDDPEVGAGLWEKLEDASGELAAAVAAYSATQQATQPVIAKEAGD